MSETAANRSRTRRRVVRQAGPPVEGDTAGIEIQESVAAVASPEPVAAAAAPGTAVADDAETGTVAAESVAPVELSKQDAKPADDADTGESAEKAETGAAAADADAEPEPEPESTESKSRIRRITASLGRTGTVAAVVALVSMLVLLGSTGLYFYHDHRADELSQRRADYIQVAKQAYIDMATVKDSTADKDIDRLLSIAGGGLKDEYAQNRDAYKKVFEQMKVQSTGTVLAAAVESDSADSATVLLLAQQTVSNVATNGPMQRDYRVRVHLTRHDGTVVASNLEFVP